MRAMKITATNFPAVQEFIGAVIPRDPASTSSRLTLNGAPLTVGHWVVRTDDPVTLQVENTAPPAELFRQIPGTDIWTDEPLPPAKPATRQAFEEGRIRELIETLYAHRDNIRKYEHLLEEWAEELYDRLEAL